MSRSDRDGIKIDHTRKKVRLGRGGDKPSGAVAKSTKGPAKPREEQRKAVVKITSFAKSRTQVFNHVSYLMQETKAKDGPTLELDNGDELKGKSASARFIHELGDAMEPKPARPSTAKMVLAMEGLAEKAGVSIPEKAKDNVRDGVAFLALQKGEKLPATEQQQRRSMNMVLSAPDKSGYTVDQVRAFARDFGHELFLGKYRYGFVIHEDKGHVHAHFVVGIRGVDGKSLNPKRDDLAQWREAAAKIGAQHGITMTAGRSETAIERRQPWHDREKVDARTASLVANVAAAALALDRATSATLKAADVGRRDAAVTAEHRKRAPTDRQLAAIERLEAKSVAVVGEDVRKSRKAASAWLDEHSGPSPATLRRVAQVLYPRTAGERVPGAEDALAAKSPLQSRARKHASVEDGRIERATRAIAVELSRPGAPTRVLREFATQISKQSGQALSAAALTTGASLKAELERIAPGTVRAIEGVAGKERPAPSRERER